MQTPRGFGKLRALARAAVIASAICCPARTRAQAINGGNNGPCSTPAGIWSESEDSPTSSERTHVIVTARPGDWDGRTVYDLSGTWQTTDFGSRIPPFAAMWWVVGAFQLDGEQHRCDFDWPYLHFEGSGKFHVSIGTRYDGLAAQPADGDDEGDVEDRVVELNVKLRRFDQFGNLTYVDQLRIGSLEVLRPHRECEPVAPRP